MRVCGSGRGRRGWGGGGGGSILAFCQAAHLSTFTVAVPVEMRAEEGVIKQDL